MQAYPFFSVVIQDFLSFGYCDSLKDGLACTVKVFRTTLFLSTASLSGLHISHNNNSKGQPCSKTNKECMGIWTSNLLLWATPMSTVLLTINHYQRMQHHFCLIANCLQLGIHQLIIYFNPIDPRRSQALGSPLPKRSQALAVLKPMNKWRTLLDIEILTPEFCVT